MSLDEQQQRDLFARSRADLQHCGILRDSRIPKWLETARIQRMRELWDAEAEPLNIHIPKVHTITQTIDTREGKYPERHRAGDTTFQRDGNVIDTSVRLRDSGARQVQFYHPQSASVNCAVELHHGNKQNIYEEQYEPEWQTIQNIHAEEGSSEDAIRSV